MLDYAYHDVAHLLQIKDKLRDLLLEVAEQKSSSGKLTETRTKHQFFVSRCHNIALKVYKDFKKEPLPSPPWTLSNPPWGAANFGDKSFVNAWKQLKKLPTAPPLETLAELYLHRDKYARVLDWHGQRVMKDWTLIKIAQSAGDLDAALKAFKQQAPSIDLASVEAPEQNATVDPSIDSPSAAPGEGNCLPRAETPKQDPAIDAPRESSPAAPAKGNKTQMSELKRTQVPHEQAVNTTVEDRNSNKKVAEEMGQWECFCPTENCKQRLLNAEQTEDICLIESSSNWELTTTTEFSQDGNHGLASKQKQKQKKKKTLGIVCRSCGVDVGVSEPGRSGHFTPIFKCGKTKPSQHVRFKRPNGDGDDGMKAKEWKEKYEVELKRRGAGRLRKRHKAAAAFQPHTVMVRVDLPLNAPCPGETLPQLGMDEWFSRSRTTERSWLGLAHCTDSDRYGIVQRELGKTEPRVRRSSQCCYWRVYAISIDGVPLVLLVPGSSYIYEPHGLLPRGVMEEDEQFRKLQPRIYAFMDTIFKLRGFLMPSDDKRWQKRAILLPCSEPFSASLWYEDQTKYLWSGKLLEKLVEYCEGLWDRDASAEPYGRIVQSIYKDRYIHMCMREDMTPESTFSKSDSQDNLSDNQDISYLDYHNQKLKDKGLSAVVTDSKQPMWQVSGPVKRYHTDTGTFLIPSITMVLKMRTEVVDAIHSAVSKVLAAGISTLSVALTPNGEKYLMSQKRSEWKLGLKNLRKDLPVLERIEAAKLQEALSFTSYREEAYHNYDRLEFLGDKVTCPQTSLG